MGVFWDLLGWVGLLRIWVGRGFVGWFEFILFCVVFIVKLLFRRGGSGLGFGYLLLYIVYVCDI